MSDKYDYIFDLIGETIKTETVVKFEIKNNTVYGYTGNVECLVLPDMVTKINDRAFANHAELKKIYIGKNTKKIGKYAFKDCKQLEEIIWSTSLTEIGEEAFAGCQSLKSIVFPESLKKIGDSAFAFCSNLSSIIFPQNLYEIGLWAFNGAAIDKVVIPIKVKMVCNGAFINCRNLKTITVLFDTPQSKKRVEWKGADWVYTDKFPFKELKSKGGWGPDWNYMNSHGARYYHVFKQIQGDFILNEFSSYTLSGYNGTGGDIDVPATIDTVSEYALFNNSTITTITFNGRMRIEKNAFAFASGLQKIVFKAGISQIDEEAFSFCKNLKQVIIEDSSYGSGKIESHSFLNCSKLTDVKISKSVRSIAFDAFEGCPCKVEHRYCYF
jgi:hypothetical protein